MYGFVEIDLMHLLGVILKKWWVILLTAILFGSMTYLYTEYFIVPLYKTSISVYVNNIGDDSKRTDTINTADLNASQRLVNTYVTIISSNTVLDKVSEKIGLVYNSSEIRTMMSCAAVRDTEIFTVTITNAHPESAANIANTIADIAVAEIPKFLEGSSVKIVDYALVPLSPFSPDVLRNIIMGLTAGLLLMILIVAAIDIFDKRIKLEDDLMRLSDIPILGVIPDFLSNNKKESKYGYYTQSKGETV